LDRETLLRTLLAGAVIIAIMWAMPHVMPLIWPPAEKPAAPAPGTPKAPPDAPAAPGETPPPAAPGEQPAAPSPAEVAAPPAEAVPALAVVGAEGAEAEATVVAVTLGSDTYGGDFDLQAVIDPKGAALVQLSLARHDFFKTVADRGQPPDERGPLLLIDAESHTRAFTIPELRLRLKDAVDWAVLDLSQAVWRRVPGDAGPATAAFAVDVRDAQGKTLLTVTKRFVLHPRTTDGGEAEPQYEMGVTLELVSADPRVEKATYTLQGPAALGREDGRADDRRAVAGQWDGGAVRVEFVEGAKIEKAEDAPKSAPARQSLAGAGLAWVGQVNKYFAVILIPQKPSKDGTFAAGASAVKYTVQENQKDVALPAVEVVTREVGLTPGEPVTHALAVFAGPKSPDHLERHYADVGLAELIQWTQCFIPLPGVNAISRLLLGVLELFYALVGNYGVAIILLVVCLRVVLFPVSRWSQKSMAEMQKMAPKMQEIKQKYAHDQKKMQEELAKVGGLKSMAGCLPMFIQMPIWIGLYGALGVAIQLRHAALLPAAWVPEWSMFMQDLSTPDALVSWSTPWFIPGQSIPLLGWLITSIQGMLGGGLTSLNVLPLAVAAAMFVQQKFMTPPATAASNPQAEQQRKMMMFMPFFLGLVLYSAPSGLNLYIATSTLLGVLEYRFFKRQREAPGASPAPVADGPRGQDNGPKGNAKAKSLVSGRQKSLAERAEAWIKGRLEKK
jgi:YidC/Oxa1 family membrane protein insertase